MNKFAFITGASSGLGREFIDLLLQQGYLVGIFARRSNILKEIENKYPGQVFAYVGDVTKKEELEQALSSFLAGRELDLFIHCAGILLLDYEDRSREICFQVNYAGTKNAFNLVRKYINTGTKLLFIASAGSLFDIPEEIHYSKSKQAAEKFLIKQRPYVLSKGGTLTIAYPSIMDTPMTQRNDLPAIARIFPFYHVHFSAKRILEDTFQGKFSAFITSKDRVLGTVAKRFPILFKKILGLITMFLK